MKTYLEKAKSLLKTSAGTPWEEIAGDAVDCLRAAKDLRACGRARSVVRAAQRHARRGKRLYEKALDMAIAEIKKKYRI